MSLHSALSALAGLLMLAGFVPYIIYIFKNRESAVKGKPQKVSWIVWVFLDTVSLLGMIFAGSVNMLSFAAVTGGCVVLALAFRFGKPGWETLDKLCLAGGVLGIVLWYTTANPTIAIIASNMAVFVGAFPTFESVYKEPEGESRAGWVLYWLSCVLATAIIPQWDFDHAMQPVTFLVIDSIVMWLLFRPNNARPAVQA